MRTSHALNQQTNENIVRGPPQVVVFRALNSDQVSLPERGVLCEARVLASERLSFIIDIGDGFKRRISRTIGTVLSDFNSSEDSITRWDDVGRRLAVRSRPNMNSKSKDESKSTCTGTAGYVR